MVGHKQEPRRSGDDGAGLLDARRSSSRCVGILYILPRRSDFEWSIRTSNPLMLNIMVPGGTVLAYLTRQPAGSAREKPKDSGFSSRLIEVFVFGIVLPGLSASEKNQRLA